MGGLNGLGTVLLGTGLLAIPAGCQQLVRAAETETRSRWIAAHLLNPNSRPPFSFVIGGVPSDAVLAAWQRMTEKKTLDKNRTQYTLVWTDPKAGFKVRCVAVEYADFPALEWTVYVSNTGTSNTPILENLQGLDASFDRTGDGEFVLHGIKGDFCTADSYQPYESTLSARSVRRFAPAASGKSSDGPTGWPYFNLQMPGRGVILAVGWPGQWAASFSRDEGNGVRIVAGQERTHLYLKPGEEIRTPLIVLLFWQGTDMVSAQNLWRRWYVTHNMPRVNG
jgi:alpha-galactosidase